MSDKPVPPAYHKIMDFNTADSSAHSRVPVHDVFHCEDIL